MQRERITDKIFVFRSDLYAQVTSGAVITEAGAVLIDTLLYPEETLRIRRFIEDGLGSSVKFVINTHFHADHTAGTCFFPDAQVIAHHLCRDILDTRGREGLARMKANAPDFDAVELILPNITFDDRMTLRLGSTTLTLRESPGHSPDSIVCLVEEEKVLFAADSVMPIPYFVDGDFAQFEHSLKLLLNGDYENIIQGHGDIILRGEAPEKITGDIHYLRCLQERLQSALQAGYDEIAARISLTDCGKSDVLLNGVVKQLHLQNILAMQRQFAEPSAVETEQFATISDKGNTV